jgi:uncharacterized membrane protein
MPPDNGDRRRENMAYQEKIAEFEKRMAEERKFLNDLIDEYECSGKQNLETNKRIGAIETEILSIRMNLGILRKESLPQPSPVQQNRPGQAAYVQQGNVPPVQPVPQPATAQQIRVPQTAPAWQFGTQPVPPVRPVQKQRTQDFEKTVGQSWMGIFASVLIFISLILFATIFVPVLSDAMKMVIMFAVSFAFAGFGIVRMRTGRRNAFYLALAGCGVGAVFISLLLSNVYFRALGNIPLYVLIFLWSVGVCFLGRLKSRIFEVIGLCGIFAAVCFGCSLYWKNHSPEIFLTVVIFFMIASAVFFLSHHENRFRGDAAFHIFTLTGLTLLVICKWGELKLPHAFDAAGILLLIAVCLQMILLFRMERGKKGDIGFAVLATADFLLLLILLYYQIGGEFYNRFGREPSLANIHQCAVFLILSAVLFTADEFRHAGDNAAAKHILRSVTLFTMVCAITGIPFLTEHLYLTVLIVPLIAEGFAVKDNALKITGISFLAVFAANTFSMIAPSEHLTEGLICFFFIFFLLWREKEQYRMALKLATYILLLLFFASDMKRIFFSAGIYTDFCNTVAFTAVSIVNMAAMKSQFVTDFSTGRKEKDSVVLTDIVNGILMLYSLVMISDIRKEPLHIILVLTALALFSMNSAELVRGEKKNLTGIYVSFKYTVLSIVILYSFEAANYAISVACFLISIACIVAGFRLSVKSMRIYGLVLSMLSIAKLILVDITYANTPGRAAGFFVCGLLCFVISLIYNFVDKRIEKGGKDKG